jgi:protein-S-isoprenylcysteine O-methyltransferase Ste14
MRELRLRAVWLIVIPFLWFSSPSFGVLATGALVVALGLGMRAWAAGTIRKDEALTTTGPYAFTRNPLYLGSLFIGVGVAVAGGHWVWPAVFLIFYTVVYSRTIASEGRRLGKRFPDLYATYSSEVPSFLPRVTPYRASGVASDPSSGFRWSQYRRNREWEASLGALATFGFLAAKVVLQVD